MMMIKLQSGLDHVNGLTAACLDDSSQGACRVRIRLPKYALPAKPGFQALLFFSQAIQQKSDRAMKATPRKAVPAAAFTPGWTVAAFFVSGMNYYNLLFKAVYKDYYIS